MTPANEDEQAPALTSAQLQQMAHRGVELRRARIRFLGQITDKDNPVDFATAFDQARLEENRETYGRIRALNFVTSIPGFGRTRAGHLLDSLGLSHRKYLGTMTAVQAERLVEAIKDALGQTALGKRYGRFDLDTETVVDAIHSATRQETAGNLAHVRVRDVVERMSGVTRAGALNVVYSAGIDVNARFSDISSIQATNLSKALPDSSALDQQDD